MDKVLHFDISFVVAFLDPVLAYAVGVGKEIFDAARGGMVDAYDLAADFPGVLASAAMQ
jgi:hypothetical protein